MISVFKNYVTLKLINNVFKKKKILNPKLYNNNLLDLQ